MSHVLALPGGTVLADDYEIERVLGAGGFGITYLARETALDRLVTIKEYFPADFAHRLGSHEAVPRSEGVNEDYQWGLDRFISEAQTLARFDHPNIVKVYRYFRAHNTGYMVLHFEEGQSLKNWLKGLGRAPRQHELDDILAPLLDALEVVHAADYLHRDIAPDNIIIRKDGSPVLIDFGSARGEIAQHSRTLSALVKPGYSPYEQYAETGHRQGPWTDMYAMAATLFHAVTGKRPPDAPSRVVKDEIRPAREVALSSYRSGFLAAIDRALSLDIDARPLSIPIWRGELLAPDPKPQRTGWLRRTAKPDEATAILPRTRPLGDVVPPAPDAPGQHGGFLDFVDGLKKKTDPDAADVKSVTRPEPAETKPTPPSLLARVAEIAAPVPPSPAPKIAPTLVAAPLPLEPASSPKRKMPRPKPVRSRTAWRPLITKLAIGAGIASVVVWAQDHLIQPRPPATPTEARTPGKEARAQQPTRQPTSEIETRSLPSPTGSPQKASVTAAPAPRPTTETPLRPAPAEVLRFSAHRGDAVAAQFAADGRSIITLGRDGILRSFVFETGTSQRTIPLALDGPAVLAVSGWQAAVGHGDGSVTVWDLERGEQTARLAGGTAPVTAIALAAGNRLAVGTADGAISIWDVKQTAASVHTFEGHEGAVRALAFNPLGTTLASGGADRTVRTWDITRKSSLRTLRGHRTDVTGLDFTPDGRTLASSAADGGVRVWSASSGRTLRALRGPKVAITDLAFSPAGDLLATSWEDGTVRLTGTTRWRTLESLNVSGAAPRSVTFSPDGRYVASATSDGSVNGWSAILGRAKDGTD